MKIKKKNSLNKEVVKFCKTMIIALFLVISVFIAGIPTSNAGGGSFPPKTIWGYVYYCSGGVAVGASVVVHANTGGYPDETATTDGTGGYLVDIGPETGTEWPDGTPFTVTATLDSWSGSNTGQVHVPPPDSTQCDVTMNPPTLLATANANPTIVVVGETIQFTGSATGGTTSYTWNWDFGDGTPHSSQQNPTHSYSTTGMKTATLTVTDTCSNTDTDDVIITVNPALSCDANGPYIGTKCNSISFTGTATGGHPGYTWDWDFGDDTTHSTLQNPTHIYANDGSYTATLTVTDSYSATAVDTASVTISTPAVVADAGGPYSGTICNPISFTGSASGGCTPYSYSWTFGDGDSGSGQFPSHQYSSDGSYTATVTVTDSKGSVDTDTASVTITTPALVADANGPYDGYTGKSISFIGSATGGCTPYSYSWTFGDGGTSDQQNPTHTYSTADLYTVTLTITDSKSTSDVDTTTATIVASDLDVDAGGPYYGEVNVPIQFYGNAAAGTSPYSYQWSFGDGSTSTMQNPTHAYSEPSSQGGYQVTLYVTDSIGLKGWGYTSAYVTGDIDEPTADAGGPYQGTVGGAIQFTGSAFGGTSPYSFSWDFDDADGIQVDSTLQNPTYTYNSPGVYTVTLMVTDDDGKTDDDTATVTISELSADLECEGSISLNNVKSGSTVNGSFTVRNIGGQRTKLDWEISSYPDWGTWTFIPSNGIGLTPENGSIIIQVTILAPKAKSTSFLYNLFHKAKSEDFTGNITIVNQGNPGDNEVIPVSVTVSKSKTFTFFDLYEYFIQRFTFIQKLLNLNLK